MRRHAPRTRPLAAVAALSAGLSAGLLTSCGIAAPSTAATVDGHDISIEAVSRMAESDYLASQSADAFGQVSTPEGTEGADVQRLALSVLLQDKVYEIALREEGATASADDRARAEELLAGVEGQGAQFDAASRAVFERLVVAQVALARKVTGVDTSDPVTPAKVEAFFEANRDQFGELTCLNGFQLLAEGAPAAQAAIDGGATVDDVVGDATLGAQPLSPDGQDACVAAGQVNEALADLVGATPVGEWASTVVDGQGGQSIAIFLRPSSRGPAELDNPVVSQQIEQQLTESASAALQQALAEVGPTIERTLRRIDVEVDPRYGRWDPEEPTLVVPPVTPRLSAADARAQAAESPLTQAP